MQLKFTMLPSTSIPTVTREQMILLDKLMEEEYQITLFQMMENAGFLLARLLTYLYPETDHVFVLAGKGNNGGGGLVATRRLVQWGYNVTVLTPNEPNEFNDVTMHQLQPLIKLQVPILTSIEEQQAVLASSSGQIVIIDALLGYSVQSPPRGTYASLISLANSLQAPIISLDTPTGMDVTTGEIYEPTIKASKTLTLGTLKTGFFKETSIPYHGDVYIADISIPPQLFEKLNMNFPFNVYKESSIVKMIHEKQENML